MSIHMIKRSFVLLAFLTVLHNSCQCSRPVEQSGSAQEAGSRQAQHWILLTLDTLRQDYVGVYGHPEIRTPALDRLSRRSLCFSEARTEATWTIPSHASLMTSRFPGTHGANFTYRFLDDQLPTAATILSGEGFLCGAVTSACPVAASRGFSRGFSFFDDCEDMQYRDGAETTARSCQWLEKAFRTGKPVFFWQHIFDPHIPYQSPAPYNTMYSPGRTNDFDTFFLDSAKRPRHEDKQHTVTDKQQQDKTKTCISYEGIQRGIRLYQGEISYTDRQVEKLLIFLSRCGVLDSTLITVVSDHGEFLGEKKLYFKHGRNLFDPVLRIVMMVHLPNQKTDRQLTTNVQLTDILPTALKVLKVDTTALHLDGRDLIALCTGQLHDGRDFTFHQLTLLNSESHYCTTRKDRKFYLQQKSGLERRGYYFLEESAEDVDFSQLYMNEAGVAEKQLRAYRESLTPFVLKNQFVETDSMVENLKALGYIM